MRGVGGRQEPGGRQERARGATFRRGEAGPRPSRALWRSQEAKSPARGHPRPVPARLARTGDAGTPGQVARCGRRLASDPPGRPSGLPEVGAGARRRQDTLARASPRGRQDPHPQKEKLSEAVRPLGSPASECYSPGSKSGTTAWYWGPTRMPPPPAGKAEGGGQRADERAGAGAARAAATYRAPRRWTSRSCLPPRSCCCCCHWAPPPPPNFYSAHYWGRRRPRRRRQLRRRRPRRRRQIGRAHV